MPELRGESDGVDRTHDLSDMPCVDGGQATVIALLLPNNQKAPRRRANVPGPAITEVTRMTKWIFAGAAAILSAAALLVPTAAVAEPFTPELEADYAAALAWWGVGSPPQCATVGLELTAADTGEFDGIEAIARATEPLPGEAGLACVVEVFENHWSELTACAKARVARHEVGHLLGHGHSEDPADVMYPGLTAADGCARQMIPTPLEAARWRRLLQRERCAQIDPVEHPHWYRLCWAHARADLREVQALSDHAASRAKR